MTHAAALLPLTVAWPLLGAVLLAGPGRWLRRTAADALATAWATAQLALLAGLWAAAGDGRLVSWVAGWTPVDGHSVGIVLAADRIGAGLALLAAALVLAALGYAWRYFDEPETEQGHGGAFPALLLLFEAGMCGFALTGDLFDAFVFFELMGVAAYALTAYRVEEPRPLQGALAFALTGSVAGYCALLGIGLLYARTGELALARIGEALGRQPPGPVAAAAFAMIATAMLVKAAAVPFHFWLPDAHAEAPSPVCMLLSGVMVELGLYGLLRVYWTVFSGPGGIPAEVFRTTFLVLGALTALTGAVLCWQQRHLKRLLAHSTVGHMGLFLCAAALLTPAGTAGAALYALGHAGAKAALFALVGVLLDRFGSVDEHGLHGRGRDLVAAGALTVAGALALAGLPPFGTGLGKAVAEHATAHGAPWLLPVFLLVPAVTAGAVLRAALRVFAGAGATPRQRHAGPETTGGGEEPEVRDPSRRVPRVMLVVPALLLGASLAVGLLPGLAHRIAEAAALFCDPAGYAAAVTGRPAAAAGPPVPEVEWTATGVLLGLAGAVLAAAMAAAALWGPALKGPAAGAVRAAADRAIVLAVVPLRRLHSGHVGDYVAWLAAGLAALMAVFTLCARAG
ncbi:complex I subunit 5 family protein [Streptomyces sp. NPDC127112]|uniref:complex I subunit 5 family protein n=1 Tax=Streptomyces sp. NPDC127112 TaxID=3345364 RepID=UPI00362AEA92